LVTELHGEGLHTTHLEDLPERVTIVRRKHPFEGQSLAVLGQTHRQGRLHWVLILPDGSRSLIPAEWTEVGSSTRQAVNPTPASLASLDDLLHMRTVVDALQRRATESPRDIAQTATADAGEESSCHNN
jgi:hypothetical protein